MVTTTSTIRTRRSIVRPTGPVLDYSKDAHKTEVGKIVVGALLAYLILIAWVVTTLSFLVCIPVLQAVTAGTIQEIKNATELVTQIQQDEELSNITLGELAEFEMELLDVSPNEESSNKKKGGWNFDAFFPLTVSMDEECIADPSNCMEFSSCKFINEQDGPAASLHNISFGLITAVIVANFNFGSGNGNSNVGALRARVRYLIEESDHVKCGKRRHFRKFLLKYFVRTCVAIYATLWTVFGLACLIVGSYFPVSVTGPLFTTGQTWLGIVITTTYMFFGIDNSKKDDEDHHIDDNNTEDKEGQNRESKFGRRTPRNVTVDGSTVMGSMISPMSGGNTPFQMVDEEDREGEISFDDNGEGIQNHTEELFLSVRTS